MRVIAHRRRQSQQLIGRIAHRRHHDDHLMPLPPGRHDAPRDRLELLGRRHRAAPVLLNDDPHEPTLRQADAAWSYPSQRLEMHRSLQPPARPTTTPKTTPRPETHPMRITVIGSGYVGLVVGACLANVGHDILCADVDPAKVARLERPGPLLRTRPRTHRAAQPQSRPPPLHHRRRARLPRRRHHLHRRRHPPRRRRPGRDDLRRTSRHHHRQSPRRR
jgi:hypothetical protein